MNEKLILACLIPVLVALVIAVAVLAVMVWLYRRRCDALTAANSRLHRKLKISSRRTRRAESVMCLLDVQREADADTAKRELNVARSMRRQAERQVKDLQKRQAVTA